MTRTLLLASSLLVACGPSTGATGTDPTTTDAGSGAGPSADTTTMPGNGHDNTGGPAGDDTDGGSSSSDGVGVGDGDGDGDSSSDTGRDPCRGCVDTDCTMASCEEGICVHRTVKPCDEFDGTADIWLLMSVVAHEPRLDAYTPGSLLRVYGEQYYCDEDKCGFVEWAVVRDNHGDLLNARFIYKPSPDPLLLDLFGLTVDNWLAPLTLVAEDQDYCEPFDGGCGDDSWQQRATYDLLHDTEAPARLIDSSVGWASGGFSVSTPYWQDGFVTCILQAPAIVSMFRDACDDDCPPPTFVDSCEPPLRSSSSYDYLSINVMPHGVDNTDGPFDAMCTVLSTDQTPKPAGELDILVALDCLFTVEPDSM